MVTDANAVTAINVNAPHTTDFIVTDLPYPAFTDVGETDYFKNPILWAADMGVTSGTSDTTFSPDTTCTRAQITTLLYRYFVK